MSSLFAIASPPYQVVCLQSDNYAHILQVPDTPHTIVLWDTDSVKPIKHFKHTQLFRTSLLRSQQQPNEHVLPAHLNYSFSCHFRYTNATPLPHVRRTPIPRVGFCGCASSHASRKTVCTVFQKDARIATQFIDTLSFIKTKQNRQHYYDLYYNNMLDNDFILCCRGAGNWSIRLYETMCAGRIPVVLDTDIVFPKELHIDWNNLIIVDTTAQGLADKVVEWHQRDIAFLRRKQQQIFNVWYTELRPQVFFNNVLTFRVPLINITSNRRKCHPHSTSSPTHTPPTSPAHSTTTSPRSTSPSS